MFIKMYSRVISLCAMSSDPIQYDVWLTCGRDRNLLFEVISFLDEAARRKEPNQAAKFEGLGFTGPNGHGHPFKRPRSIYDEKTGCNIPLDMTREDFDTWWAEVSLEEETAGNSSPDWLDNYTVRGPLTNFSAAEALIMVWESMNRRDQKRKRNLMDVQAVLDSVKDRVTDGVYLELSNSLLGAFKDLE